MSRRPINRKVIPVRADSAPPRSPQGRHYQNGEGNDLKIKEWPEVRHKF